MFSRLHIIADVIRQRNKRLGITNIFNPKYKRASQPRLALLHLEGYRSPQSGFNSSIGDLGAASKGISS